MKTLIHLTLFAACLFLITPINVDAQSLTYTTKSKEAKKLAAMGTTHMANAEFEWAYNDFSEALKLDPDFTYAQLLLSNLAVGSSRKMYADMAKNTAKNKSEGEKMLVKLIDTKTRAEGHDVWNAVHQKFPDDMNAYYYSVITNPDAEAGMKSLEEFLKKYPNYPPANNYMGYQLMQVKKDTAAAKPYFEKYLELYPDGYNPYDLMGEYYLAVGDKENSLKYYNKCREKYPFSHSAQTKLEEIAKMQ